MPRSSRVALLSFIALTLVPAASIGARTQDNDDATVLHVLNRAAYGPRPGDIERGFGQNVGWERFPIVCAGFVMRRMFGSLRSLGHGNIACRGSRLPGPAKFRAVGQIPVAGALCICRRAPQPDLGSEVGRRIARP